MHSAKKKKSTRLLILIIAAGGLAPVLLYLFTMGSVPSVTAAEAASALKKQDAAALLVDVRERQAADKKSLFDSVNWPFAEINALQRGDKIPEQFEKNSLFLICRSGIASVFAVKKLRRLMPEKKDIFHVLGGVQEWQSGPGREQDQVFRKTSIFGQIVLSAAAFGLKPLYMILSLMLAFFLWRSKLPDLMALRWAFLSFFLGEAACAANYIFFQENSHLFEYLHMFGMVSAFGFTTFAFFEALDAHLLHYSDKEKKCAALPLCAARFKNILSQPRENRRRKKPPGPTHTAAAGEAYLPGPCYKNSAAVCAFERTFKLALPVSIILCLLPLLAKPYAVSYNTRILGTLYQSIHPVLYQIYEIRAAPITAVILFAAALAAMLRRKENSFFFSRIFFASGMGFLGFSLFRLVLFALYRDDLTWFASWEELTEFLYIAGAWCLLWIFHGGPASWKTGGIERLP